ncbi:MAG: hypothetical protein LBT09_03260 [Planctomycetaceae bacterium]|nr:hypothetical protein [Planctomycetaceae bacterium]
MVKHTVFVRLQQNNLTKCHLVILIVLTESMTNLNDTIAGIVPAKNKKTSKPHKSISKKRPASTQIKQLLKGIANIAASL